MKEEMILCIKVIRKVILCFSLPLILPISLILRLFLAIRKVHKNRYQPLYTQDIVFKSYYTGHFFLPHNSLPLWPQARATMG